MKRHFIHQRDAYLNIDFRPTIKQYDSRGCTNLVKVQPLLYMVGIRLRISESPLSVRIYLGGECTSPLKDLPRVRLGG